MKKPAFKDRLRYTFDNALSKGPATLIGWLAFFSIVLVLLSAFLIWATGLSEGSLLAQIWTTLMQTLVPEGVDRHAGSWPFLLVMFFVTLGGIFITSTLISILTAGLHELLYELRRGRSRVVESGHTVIIGWSEQIFTIISELAIANENQPRSCIAILARKDKVVMEEEIRRRGMAMGHTHVVCRTGNPLEWADLSIASLDTARAIIVLSREGQDPDSTVIKTILTILNNPNRRSEPYHVVAAIRDPQNLEVARIAGRGEVEVIPVGNFLARIIAQTCHQSGLSVVYTELLSFGGDEIYFQEEPALIGKTYAEALLSYEDSAVIGLWIKEGLTSLNPPMDTVIREGDEIIAISEDDDTVRLSGLSDKGIKYDTIQVTQNTPLRPERVLILGWNWRSPAIIRELDNYVAPGSKVTIVADQDVQLQIEQCCSELSNLAVFFQEGNTTDRRTLDRLHPEEHDHVIVLSYSNIISPQQADARTLVTLLHLRDIADQNVHPFTIVTEILDVRDRKLAEITRADDFVVSDRLISLMLTQVAERKELNWVFAELLASKGAEIYLKPARDYVQLGRSMNFYTVVEAASRRGETAIGYRLHASVRDEHRLYGVVVNPDKSDPIMFSESDRIIVLAED